MDKVEQARIDQQIADHIAKLDLESEFTTAGRAWTESDADGNIVYRDPHLEYLRQIFPTALIASLAGLRDPQDLNEPTPEVHTQIQFAARIARRIEAAESRETAAAWLASANEALGGELPIKAIRDGRHAEVEAAAERFISGWAG